MYSESDYNRHSKKYDITVFGATGFTGKHVVKELVHNADEINHIAWAIAGRNGDKLKDVLEWAFDRTGKDISKVDRVIADVSDERSIISMCKESKLILNLVGPYHLYGEVVVKACIENGCHHVDISGEPQWLERMELEYHAKAKEAGVFIVQACGFDSIPADMGLIFTRKQFPGILNSVDCYMQIHTGPAGSKVNVGTLNSLLHAVANRKDIPKIREQQNHQPVPKLLPKLQTRNGLFYSDDNNSWCVPFPGPDVPVMKRTQRFLYEHAKTRPIQYGYYFSGKNLIVTLFAVIGAMFLGLLALFRCGRSLLQKYPEIFTLGMFGHGGPTQEQMDGNSFQFKFYGKGFSDEGMEQKNKEDMKIVTSCTGPDPGYIGTSALMVQAGLTILHETFKLPAGGGVFTPGAAFHDTTLIKRCGEHGIKFSVVSGAKKI